MGNQPWPQFQNGIRERSVPGNIPSNLSYDILLPISFCMLLIQVKRTLYNQHLPVINVISLGSLRFKPSDSLTAVNRLVF